MLAIPNEEKWFELKKLLNIKTNEFDKQITEFEIKENEFESSNRAYHEDGICPTITTIDAPKLIQVAQLDGFESSGSDVGVVVKNNIKNINEEDGVFFLH